MKSKDIAGDVAVVAPAPASARRAATSLKRQMPAARLLPLSLAQYRVRRGAPLPVILAPAGADEASDRRFLETARNRILWEPAPADLYAAIAGVLTHLPERRRPRRAKEGEPATALLLEGAITGARARAALASPARHWIVEHVGRVRLSGADLESLSVAGVRWSVLQPVVFLGIADRTGGARRLFPRATHIWRV